MPVKSEIDNNVEASLKAQFENLDDKAIAWLSDSLFHAKDSTEIGAKLDSCPVKALNALAKAYDFNVLSSGNCKNFTLTSKNPPNEKFVLRLDFVPDSEFTAMKDRGDLNDIVALEGEISRNGNIFFDSINRERALVLCAYCPQGSMLDFAKNRQTDTQDSPIDKPVIVAASNMANAFLQFQDKGLSFFDGKITNFLANGSISDRKSIANNCRGLWNTPKFNPPEMVIVKKLNKPMSITDVDYRDKVHAYILGKNLYSLIVGKLTNKDETNGADFDFSHPAFATPIGKSYKRLIEKLVTPSFNERLGVKKATEHLKALSNVVSGKDDKYNQLASDEEKDLHLQSLDKEFVEEPFSPHVSDEKKQAGKEILSRLKALKYQEPDYYMEYAISKVYAALNAPNENPKVLEKTLKDIKQLEKYQVVQKKLLQMQKRHAELFKNSEKLPHRKKADKIYSAMQTRSIVERIQFLKSQAADLIDDVSGRHEALKNYLIDEIISKKNNFQNVDFDNTIERLKANKALISIDELVNVHYALSNGDPSPLKEISNSHSLAHRFIKPFGDNYPLSFKKAQEICYSKPIVERPLVMARALFNQKKSELKQFQYSPDSMMIDNYIKQKAEELNKTEPKDLDNFFDKLEKDITALRDISKIQDMIRNKEVKLSKKSKTFCPHAHRKAKAISQAMTSFSIEERIKVLSGMSSENGFDAKLDNALNMQRARYFKTDEASTFTEYKKMKEQLISNRADVKSKASVETPSQKFHPKQ